MPALHEQDADVLHPPETSQHDGNHLMAACALQTTSASSAACSPTSAAATSPKAALVRTATAVIGLHQPLTEVGGIGSLVRGSLGTACSRRSCGACLIGIHLHEALHWMIPIVTGLPVRQHMLGRQTACTQACRRTTTRASPRPSASSGSRRRRNQCRRRCSRVATWPRWPCPDGTISVPSGSLSAAGPSAVTKIAVA